MPRKNQLIKYAAKMLAQTCKGHQWTLEASACVMNGAQHCLRPLWVEAEMPRFFETKKCLGIPLMWCYLMEGDVRLESQWGLRRAKHRAGEMWEFTPRQISSWGIASSFPCIWTPQRPMPTDRGACNNVNSPKNVVHTGNQIKIKCY